MIARSWRANWGRVRPTFELPAEIRRAVYTTNVIESLNFSLRKIIKGRASFPNDESVYRLIYPGPPAGQPEMDDADPELESSLATVCDPL